MKQPGPTVDDSGDPFGDILTLAEGAAMLGVSPTTLAHQVPKGRLYARQFGRTCLTTKDEIERYRTESLAQPGRKSGHHKWSEIKRARELERPPPDQTETLSDSDFV